MPRPQIPVISDIVLSAAEKLAIRQAAQRWPGAERFSELRIVRQLNEGFSSARVYEAEWVSPGPAANERVILKVDKAGRLVQEIRFPQALHGEAPSFMKVRSASFDPENPPDVLGCIFYAHAGGQFPGEIRTFSSLCTQALQEPANFQAFLVYLDNIFGILRKQLHKDLQIGSPQRQLDFYLKRWLPAAELECRQVEWQASGRVRLFLADHPAQEQPDFGGSEDADSALAGTVVAFEAAELHLTESSIYVNQPHESCFLITGISPGSVQGSHEPQAVRVEGRVLRTRLASYQEIFREAGVDPMADRLQAGSIELPNPLPGLQQRVRAWARRRPWPSYCFGHGDLHGGNVLSVGGAIAIIDHALSGEGHPAWADAARLIASLWRNAVAPRFQSEEVARILDLAFRRKPDLTEESPAALAAALLRKAFESAIAAGPAQEEARRELWIDLHHFAWIGLKWPGPPQAHLAMILLAAVAVEKIEAESQALSRRDELRSSLPARLDSEGLIQSLPAHLGRLKAILGELSEPGSELLWRFREEMQKLAGEQLRDLEANPGDSGGLLARLLGKALTRSWSPQDTVDALSVRLGKDGLYSSMDRMVLADVLFFACAFSWHGQVFGLLLDLCHAGEEEVEAEAAMVLAWLLSQEAVLGRLEKEPALSRRVQALLSRRDFLELVSMAVEVRLDVISSLPGLQFIEAVEPVNRIEHLRPFDPQTDIPAEEREGAPELSALLSASILVTESGKRSLGRRLKLLPEEQRADLLQRLRTETAKRSSWAPALVGCYRRTISLCRFAQALQQEDQEDELRQQLLLFQRSFTDLIVDEALKHLARARELAASCQFAQDAAEEERERELVERLLHHFERASSQIPLNAEDLFSWGHQASRLAELTEDSEVQRRLRQEACDKYRQAVEAKPDKHAALNNWGNELGHLAQMADEVEVQRQLRQEACDKYRRAVEVKPDKYEALYNWGIELGLLADISTDTEAQRQLRQEACDKCRRAVELKPDYHDALDNWGTELIGLALVSPEPERERIWDLAEEVLERYALGEGVPLAQVYNHACVLALRGRHSEALSSLRECLASGTISVEHVRQDPDWDGLRGDSKFEDLLEHPPERLDAGAPRKGA